MACVMTCRAEEARDFAVVRDGVAQCVIVTGDAPAEPVSRAVQELNYWVEKISGTKLPVVTASEWDGKTPYIAVGASRLTQEWEAGPMAQEEARIIVEEGRVGLLGNDVSPYEGSEWTGTYYAVLELLKKKMGVRWIWPGEIGEVYQQRDTITLAPERWTWQPNLTLIRSLRNGYKMPRNRARTEAAMKKIGVDARQWQQLSDDHEHWLLRERMNKPTNVKFGHAFSKWWDLYSVEHPDWFAKPPEGVPQLGGVGVKLNLSNPEVQEKIFQDWYRGWQEDPKKGQYMNVAPNDSRGFDTRPETRAWDAPELAKVPAKEIFNGSAPVLSDRYVRFWNLLAERIKKVDPSAKLTTYAYRNYRPPPLGDQKLADNVIIAYCGGEGYYPDERFIREEWKGWRDRGATLTWRPNMLNGGHGTPFLYPRALFEDFRAFQAQGLIGTDFDSLAGNWSGQGLMYYVLAEMHSRPEAGYDELAGEYFDAFGPAREAVREYHEYFEKVSLDGPRLLRDRELVPRETWGGWWDGYIRLVPLLFTPEVIAQGRRLLSQAEEAVKAGSEVEKERVVVLVRSLRHTELMAEAFRKLNLQDPKTSVRGGRLRDVLKPLWDFRREDLVGVSQSYATLFMEEQRQLGLWEEYFGEEVSGQDQSRVSVLTDGWTARPDPENIGVKERWEGGAGDWRPVSVAMPWRRSLKDAGDSKIVWYRVEFPVPDLADTGEKVILRFRSIDAEARIWVNGRVVAERGYPHEGNYDSWRESFDVDVTADIKPGAQNALVIRVESESKNGGVTGPVALVLKR